MSAALPMPPERRFIEEEVPVLLEGLSQDQQPLWGKMTAQHMVEHISEIFLMSATPHHEIPVMVPQERLEKAIAWLESDKQFRPNTVAPILPSEPLPLTFSNLEEAKQKFLSALDKYTVAWRAQPAMTVDHPAFGPLSRKQWEQFHMKHVHHHFRQFGLLPLADER